MHRVKTAKRAILVAAILGIASAVAAGGYWVGEQHTPTTISEMLRATEIPLTNWWETPNPIFRLPLDAQESLLLQMEYVYDTQADASPSMHGDERKRFRPSGLLQYGVGAEAQRIEQWLNKPLFGDAAHALLIEEKYGFGRPLFSFSIEEVGAELQEGVVPESLRALFHAHGESLSEQATLIDADERMVDIGRHTLHPAPGRGNVPLSMVNLAKATHALWSNGFPSTGSLTRFVCCSLQARDPTGVK
jgi:hypothetical protein